MARLPVVRDAVRRGCAAPFGQLLLAAAILAGCGGGAGSVPSAATGPAAGHHPVSSTPLSSARHQVAGQTTAAAAPQFGHRTKTSGCQVRGQLPDPACTPGSIITRATLARICATGYARAVRNVPDSLKQEVYAEYAIPSHRAGQYEVDHLVPLELGGSNGIANLWPQITPGYGEKDQVENELHGAACSGAIALREGQRAIARDWRHAGATVPALVSPLRVSHGPPTTVPGAQQPIGDFCSRHACIANFANGRGTIVQCQDGEYSHSGGRPGVCNRHGGPR